MAAEELLVSWNDTAEREFDYTTGAEHALEQAEESGFTVVSVKDGWATIYNDIG